MKISKIKVRKEKDTNWVKVTPEMAEELLKMNSEKNRKLSKVTVRRYAEDMRCGRWGKLNTNPIGVSLDDDGNIVSLIDGQHRLAAVIQSGVPVYFEFVEVADKNFRYLDQGKNRKTTDFVYEPDANNLTALARMVLRTKRYNLSIPLIVSRGAGRSADNEITPQKLLDYMNECESEIPMWRDCLSEGYKIRKGFFNKGSMAVYSYFCWLLKWLGEDDCLELFVDDVNSELSNSISVRLFKNYYQSMLVAGASFANENFISHLLWVYDNFNKCRYKKYPATKVSTVTSKYEKLIEQKKGGRNGRDSK